MGDILNSLSDNALGIFLGIMAFLLGIVSELMASAISSSVSSGHITIINKRGGWIVRIITWAKGKFQEKLEKWVFNKNTHAKGIFFMYRLEMMEEAYIWKYAEIDLDINLSNEIKGKFYHHKNDSESALGSIEGNLVLDQMLILFVFGQNDIKTEGPKEMITMPQFHNMPVNIGWAVDMESIERRPLPVVIRREMLNFPKQLLKDEGIKALCAAFPGNINWNSFKNEME